MSHPNEDPIPHAARMRAIGDLLARGIRRLQQGNHHDIRRRSGDDEILAVDPATCLDLQAESSTGPPCTIRAQKSTGAKSWKSAMV
jgi:hypothetical protein